LTASGSASVTKLDAGSGTINLESGTFNLSAGDAIGNNSTLAINSPAVVNLPGNDETVGGLAGSGTVSFKADGMVQTLFVGGNNQNTDFSGNIAGDDPKGGIQLDQIEKDGTGTLTLSGNETFTGGYSVRTGTLLVTGTLTGSGRAVFMFSTGVL